LQRREVSHAAKIRVHYTDREKGHGSESEPMGVLDQEEARQNQAGKGWEEEEVCPGGKGVKKYFRYVKG
jgi:hypothetical protein